VIVRPEPVKPTMTTTTSKSQPMYALKSPASNKLPKHVVKNSQEDIVLPGLSEIIYFFNMMHMINLSAFLL